MRGSAETLGLQELFKDWPQIAQSQKQEVSKLLNVPYLAGAIHAEMQNFDKFVPENAVVIEQSDVNNTT